MTTRQSLARWLGGRGVIVVLLAAVVFVPTLARLHQHVGRTATDEGPRFRWSTSCDAVPKKAAALAATALVPIVVGTIVTPPRPAGDARPVNDQRPLTSAVRSPHGLRAPPLSQL